MSEDLDRINAFVSYVRTLSGDEKGEAQVFCDRLFQAFGHSGYKEAGAELEHRIKVRDRATRFTDLVWAPKLLLEMKSRGQKLQKHDQQAFDYWLNAVPNRPRYVVLCNFDEFWIYDFNFQLHEPVDRVSLDDLRDRYQAFNFLFPDERRPTFQNDHVAVTRSAAENVAKTLGALIDRGEGREHAQSFVLQRVVAMFSEDFDLLPKGFFSTLLHDCAAGQSTYDLLGSLFRQMNTPGPPGGGRFTDVAYFNGGLFEDVDPVELEKDELLLLMQAASENWSKVAPPIFGTLFQSSMDSEQRHALGAHFTSEADIQKVVQPTIVRPWRERIEHATTLRDLRQLSSEIKEVKVLDPACGSGNFLYVAYRELVNLEMEVLAKIHDNFGERARRVVGTGSLLRTTQFFGIDKDPFAVELAKVTLMLAKRIALVETQDNWFKDRSSLPLESENPLPLDNLDDNIWCDDALFCDWPKVDAIIGNPPYQSKNKMQQEYGRSYLNRLRQEYPDVPGRADYCVYWFRRAHDELASEGRAGLVGTNTVRENYSREGGLDYIVNSGGTITEAVSSQVWSGDAVVHVSIVNWIKGDTSGPKKLFKQLGDSLDSPWEVVEQERISSALSPGPDVTTASALKVNVQSASCFQGQTQGHDGFVLTPPEAKALRLDRRSASVTHPYLIGTDLLEVGRPRRLIIDLSSRSDIFEAKRFEPGFPIWPWYSTARTSRRALISGAPT